METKPNDIKTTFPGGYIIADSQTLRFTLMTAPVTVYGVKLDLRGSVLDPTCPNPLFSRIIVTLNDVDTFFDEMYGYTQVQEQVMVLRFDKPMIYKNTSDVINMYFYLGCPTHVAKLNGIQFITMPKPPITLPPSPIIVAKEEKWWCSDKGMYLLIVLLIIIIIILIIVIIAVATSKPRCAVFRVAKNPLASQQ